MWDTHQHDEYGKSILKYRLTMSPPPSFSSEVICPPQEEVLFEGEDFCCSPLHAIDSDQTVDSLMSFLTMRPGDTDEDYFKDYTEAQLDYCDRYAEALNVEVMSRFGER